MLNTVVVAVLLFFLVGVWVPGLALDRRDRQPAG